MQSVTPSAGRFDVHVGNAQPSFGGAGIALTTHLFGYITYDDEVVKKNPFSVGMFSAEQRPHVSGPRKASREMLARAWLMFGRAGEGRAVLILNGNTFHFATTGRYCRSAEIGHAWSASFTR